MDEKDDLDVLMDEANWKMGDNFDSNRNLNQKNISIEARNPELNQSFPFQRRFLYIVALAETGFVATAVIKGHVVVKHTLVHKVVASKETFLQEVVAK